MSQYVLYALWNSDADNLYSKARSNAIIVTCLNPKLRISITPESYGVKKNGTIKFTGVVQDEYGNPIEGNPTVKRTITYPDGTTSTTTVEYSEKLEDSIIFTTEGIYNIVYTAEEYIGSKETYNKGTSDEFKIKCGIINTNLSLSSDKETNTNYGRCVVDDKVVLTAKLTDEEGKPVHDRTISFFENESYKLIGNVKTSADGIASIITPVSKIGDTKFIAQFDGDIQYGQKNSSLYTINAIKHSTKFILDNNTIYKGWKVKGQFVDEQDRGIGYTNITLRVEDPTITDAIKKVIFTKTIKTKEEGLFESEPLYITTTTNTLDVYMSFTDTTGRYENITSEKITLQYTTKLKFTAKSYNFINDSSKIPYREWTNLSNIYTSGAYATCGAKCTNNSAIASKNGTRHTPAPIKVNGFNFSIPDDVVVSNMKVSISTRNRSCSSESAQIKIPRPTVSINTKTDGTQTTFNNGSSYIPYNTFNTCFVNFSNLNLRSSIVNSSDFFIYITFGKNQTTNIGRIDIENITVDIEYIPIQDGGS